jgi:hypothetical protein
MRPTPATDAQLLSESLAFTFSKPVTAYLTEARIADCCCLGVTHRHIRADPVSGLFTDGRLIRTSIILRVGQEGGFWVFHTYTGSFYVIASYRADGGYQSLMEYRVFLTSGYHPAPDRLH